MRKEEELLNLKQKDKKLTCWNCFKSFYFNREIYDRMQLYQDNYKIEVMSYCEECWKKEKITLEHAIK